MADPKQPPSGSTYQQLPQQAAAPGAASTSQPASTQAQPPAYAQAPAYAYNQPYQQPGMTVVVEQPGQWGQPPTYVSVPVVGQVVGYQSSPSQPFIVTETVVVQDDWGCALCGLIFSFIPIVG